MCSRFTSLVTLFVLVCLGNVYCKPNFVIMFMDDMGWGDLGSYGNPAEETPNLDRMAREGMRFTDLYTGSAICSPSRASLMTGRLPVRNGFYSTYRRAKNSYTPQDVMGGIKDEEVLFPELLAENGYSNKIVGKWHLGHRPQYLPLKHGFHQWFGAPNCHYKYDDVVMPNIPVYRNEEMTGRYYDDYHFDHETGIGNMTQLYIHEALEFIEAEHQVKRPFLLYWAPDATHTPLYASEKFRGRSQRGLYGDAVMELDYGVGKILEKLRELGIAENTFAFFSSDNGAATYAHEDGGSNGPFLCGKQTTFEGGFRQPAIAWHPGTIRPGQGGSNGPFLCGKPTTFEGGFRQPALAWHPGTIKPGQVTNQVSNLMDIFPTVLELADIKHPEGLELDGETLVPTLHNHTEKDRAVFYYRGDTLFKARYGQYKAHFYTWETPKDAQEIGYHYCPGQFVPNVTTEEMTDYTKQPLLIHLGRDPGEKFPMHPHSEEYIYALSEIMKQVEEHEKNMKRAEPDLNWCDLAVQNWAPHGCEKIDRCMKAPESHPYVCDWPY